MKINPAISAARGADRVAVIIGSTRPARICPGVAHWSREALGEDSPLHYEVIDLAATMRPYAKLIRQLDAEMIEALEDSQ
jgi:NAD(P)H-dependent FMN reductase